MALLLMDGFDFYYLNPWARGWSFGSNSGISNSPNGRFGGRCIEVGDRGYASHALPGAPVASVIVGFATKTSGAPGYNAFQIRDAGNNRLCQVATNGSGHIYIADKNGTVKATGSGATWTTGAWHYVEVKIVQNGASGTAEIYVDGIQEIAATTGDYGTASSLYALMFSPEGAGGGITQSFDDLYVVDLTGSAPHNTFLGEVRVDTIYPTGDGAHTDFTPNSGTAHWSRVNESDNTAPNGDTSYVASATPGARDSYVFDDVSLAATVLAVQSTMYVRKDQTGLRQVRPVVRQGSTDYDGGTATLATSYQFFSQVYALDPTGAAWTAANLNADEFGVVVV